MAEQPNGSDRLRVSPDWLNIPRWRLAASGILLAFVLAAIVLHLCGVISVVTEEWVIGIFLLLVVLDRLERIHRPVPPM